MKKRFESALLNNELDSMSQFDIFSTIASLTISEFNGFKFKYTNEFNKLSPQKNDFWKHFAITPINVTKYFILIGANVSEADFILYVKEAGNLTLGELGAIHWRSIRFLDRDKELLERLLIKVRSARGTSSLLMFICILAYRENIIINKYLNASQIQTMIKGNEKWKNFCLNFIKNQNNHETLQNGSKSLKVAVLISGQFRGYEKVLPSINEALIKPLKADVFIHSWDQIGFRVPTSLEADRTFSDEFLHTWRDYLIDNDIGSLKSDFPNLFDYLENIDSLDKKHVIDLLNPKKYVFENAEHFKDWSGSKCMHYKMKSCFELANKYGDYDIFLRVRPDKELLDIDIKALVKSIEKMKKNSIMFRGEVNTGPFGIAICDQFSIGDYKGMYNYNNVFGNEDFFRQFQLPGNCYQPHSSQAFNLFYNHVNWSTVDKFIKLGDLYSIRPDKSLILKSLKKDYELNKNPLWNQKFILAIKNDLNNYGSIN